MRFIVNTEKTSENTYKASIYGRNGRKHTLSQGYLHLQRKLFLFNIENYRDYKSQKT